MNTIYKKFPPELNDITHIVLNSKNTTIINLNIIENGEDVVIIPLKLDQ